MDTYTAQSYLLESVEEQARRIGICGVGIALVVDPEDDSSAILPSMIIVDKFHDGSEGYNFMGIVWAKVAQMMRVWDDSGRSNDSRYQGENDYRGGVIREVAGRKVIVAFSGGSERQDRAVAEYAVWSLTEEVEFQGGWDEASFGFISFDVMITID